MTFLKAVYHVALFLAAIAWLAFLAGLVVC